MFDNAARLGNQVLALRPRPVGVVLNGDSACQHGERINLEWRKV